jgi:hypothetical protein
VGIGTRLQLVNEHRELTERKLTPRLPVGRNVLQRSGRRDRAAEVVAGEIPASERGKNNVTAWKESLHGGTMGTTSECSRYSKVGQSGKLPGDRSRQAVVTHAPVQARSDIQSLTRCMFRRVTVFRLTRTSGILCSRASRVWVLRCCCPAGPS